MNEHSKIAATAEDLARPVTIPVDAYVSKDYAAAEQERLWRRTWLQAGRLEDIPEVGNFITYDIGPDGIIVVRTGASEIRAYHNVCPHRGRRLIDVPAGQHNARGTKANFICGYHAWTFNLQGQCTYIQHQDDWQGALTPERTSLGKVQVDTWGGWIWINLDPDAAPLAEYLDPVPAMLDPYGLQNMRPRWRKWIVFDCNWKVAMEAFAETYHVFSTHPEFNDFGQFRGWAHTHGLHTNIGYEAPKGMEEDSGKLRVGTGDARVTTAELQNFTWANANTNTTRTLVEAANRLIDELPEDTPAMEVSRHWIQSARATDAARGVVWPTVEPAHTAVAGTAWQVFPNFQIGQAVNNMLCYSAKPYGSDPDTCIFEAAVYELYPEGEAPATEWEYTKAEDWPPVLQQDFANMAAVQQGMKNIGFRGTQPNPYMERSVASLHYNLAKFMGGRRAASDAVMNARQEWRAYPMLPIAAALGYATSVIHIYGLGPYIAPISQSFGWSRTQVTVGLTIATLVQALFSLPVGLLVDRYGPRRFGLVGIVLTTAAFALLGTATGGTLNWYGLWGLLAFATLPVQATIWTSAVATRFAASRGLAFAITLCGASVAVVVFPLLSTWLIGRYGWQTAIAVQGGIWMAIAFPVIFLFFRGAHDASRTQARVAKVDRPVLAGVSLGEGLRSTIYLRLLLASLLFTFTIIALVVHFIPILTDRGATPLAAAGIVSLVGIFSILGRLATGLLLDRFRASAVGAGVFVLPVIGCVLLLTAGERAAGQALAAAFIGATLGAEVDVIVYLTTRHFGLKSFGGLYGGLLAALSIGTATGPLGAAAVFDRYGSYAPFLWLTIGFMIASSAALLSLPRPAETD